MLLRLTTCLGILALLASPAVAITASSLAYRSSGTNPSAGDWLLTQNGYLGTYITLADAGQVTIEVEASGLAGGGVDPHLNIVVADEKAQFDVSAGFTMYEHTFTLPAGTHFVRTEFNNDVATSDRQLTIRSLNVDGATLDNTSSSANALAAANTYIENFRKGPASVALAGVAPGTPVEVKLKRHAFNFGTNVPGSSAADINSYLGNDPTTTKDENFQEFVNSHFNALVPSNYGKWSNTEGTRDVPTMDRVDTLLNYAESHNMRARMHALAWGDQNPNWVLNTFPEPDQGLLVDAIAGNATAIQALRDEISERIDYYVGTGTTSDRAHKYIELDVHNEGLHKIALWQIYGADGMAGIFNEVAQAAAASGASVKLYPNEYNVLQNSPAAIIPDTTEPIDPYNGVESRPGGIGDQYANWYRQNIDDIRNAGGDVSGVGVQYYPVNGHSADTMHKAMQNLAVTGLPFSLTEFGAQSSVTNQATAANMVEDSLRMVFGNPNAETFMYWGFWGGATSSLQSGSIMVNTTWKNPDGSWNLTPSGLRYEWLFGMGEDPTKGGENLNPWDTELTAVVGPDGVIDFTGFYGDYEITINGQTFDLLIAKGDTEYFLAVAPGDFNADGTVDMSDYILWRKSYGSTNDFRADANGDRNVDDADYDIWRMFFGRVYAGGGGEGEAPEPCTIVLAGLLALAIGITRRPHQPF
jgi:GH35 family endo-1,4-beta-xylanase